MIRAVVDAFVAGKLERTDVSLAHGPAFPQGARSVLHSAPDLEAPPDTLAIEMMFAAMAGVMRYVLEAGA